MTTKKNRKNRDNILASLEKFNTTRKRDIIKGGTLSNSELTMNMRRGVLELLNKKKVPPPSYYEANLELITFINDHNLEIKLVEINMNKGLSAAIFPNGRISNPTKEGSLYEAGLRDGDIILSYETTDISDNTLKYAFIGEKKFFDTLKISKILKISYITKKSIDKNRIPTKTKAILDELMKKIKQRIAVANKEGHEIVQHLTSNPAPAATEEAPATTATTATTATATTAIAPAPATTAPATTAIAPATPIAPAPTIASIAPGATATIGATTLGAVSPPLPKVLEREKTRLTSAYNTSDEALSNYLITNKLDVVNGKEVNVDDGKNILGFDTDINGIIISAQPKGKIVEAGLYNGDLILSYTIRTSQAEDATNTSEHIFIDRDTIVKNSTNKYTIISYIRNPNVTDELAKLIASRIKARKELDNLLTIDNDYVTAKDNLSGFIDQVLTNKVAKVYITNINFSFDTHPNGSIASAGVDGSIAKAGLKIDDIILTYKNDNDENIYISRDDFVAKAKQPPITIEYIKGTDLGNNKVKLIELINARIKAKQAFDSYIDKLGKTPAPTATATATANVGDTSGATATAAQSKEQERLNKEYSASNNKLTKFITDKKLEITEVDLDSNDFDAGIAVIGGVAHTNEGGSMYKAGLKRGDLILTYKNANDNNTNIFIGPQKFIDKAIHSPITIEYIKSESISSKLNRSGADKLQDLIRNRIKAKNAYDSYIDKLGATPRTPGTPEANVRGTVTQGQPISNDDQIENAIGAIILALALTISESMPNNFRSGKAYNTTNNENVEETSNNETDDPIREKVLKQLFNHGDDQFAEDVEEAENNQGTHTTIERGIMTRGLREDLKKSIKNIIETKFTKDQDNELLNTKIDFKNKKKLIKDILISKISYIFASGETRLNMYNRTSAIKNFKEDDERKEENNDDEREKVKPADESNVEEPDKPQTGGGGYGFRNFDKDDTKNFIGFILASLTALQYDGIVETTKKLLFSNYLKEILKIKPGELNKLLLDIDNIQLLSTSVIKHYINKLTNNQGSSSETKEVSPSPAALISKLNFGLKSNIKAFMKSIVYITLHSEQMVGSKEKIETMWDNEYNKAMKLPVGEEQTRIEKFELNNAVKAILGSTNNSIKDYREKIKAIDSYIDSINEKNIDAKLNDFPSILSVAKLKDGAIIYRLPDKIKSNLRERDAEKSEAAAVEASSKQKLQEAQQLVRDLLKAYDAKGTGTGTGTEQPQTTQQIEKTKLEKLLATLGTPPSTSDQ